MKQFVLITGSVYCGLSVILGAFGAHALKEILSPEKLQSFETGIRYQMDHGLVLLIVGFAFNFVPRMQYIMGWSFIAGVFLFSFSIYLLAFSEKLSVNLSYLGPVTPLGGLLMIVGWVLLIINLVKIKF